MIMKKNSSKSKPRPKSKTRGAKTKGKGVKAVKSSKGGKTAKAGSSKVMNYPRGLKTKAQKLRAALQKHNSVMVLFSGGTDSALLLHEAVSALGADNVVALTAVSPVFTQEEKERAQALALKLKVKHHLLKPKLLKSSTFCRNSADRCYHCKAKLLKESLALAIRMKLDAVVEASQLDDLKDYRPGAKAVEEYGVLSPFQEAGMNKEDVRKLSRMHKLPTADLPAAACLASRIPYGTKITQALLDRIGRGEAAIRKLGFSKFRLRHQDDVARLEFDPSEMERAFKYRRSLSKRIKEEGWAYVALDLDGYAQGSLNRTLSKK